MLNDTRLSRPLLDVVIVAALAVAVDVTGQSVACEGRGASFICQHNRVQQFIRIGARRTLNHLVMVKRVVRFVRELALRGHSAQGSEVLLALLARL